MPDDYPTQWILDETRLYFGAWRLKQSYSSIAWYREHYRTLKEWEKFYTSAILSSMDGVQVGNDHYPEYDPLIADEIEQFALERIEETQQEKARIFAFPQPYTPPHWTEWLIVEELMLAFEAGIRPDVCRILTKYNNFRLLND